MTDKELTEIAKRYFMSAYEISKLFPEIEILREENTRLRSELERVRTERDKAVGDAKKGTVCCTCAHYDKYCSPPNPDAGCRSWQWRGLEESK